MSAATHFNLTPESEKNLPHYLPKKKTTAKMKWNEMNEQWNEKKKKCYVRNVRLNQYRWQSNFTVRILLFVRCIILHPSLSIHILSAFLFLRLFRYFSFLFYRARKIFCLISYVNYYIKKNIEKLKTERHYNRTAYIL